MIENTCHVHFCFTCLQLDFNANKADVNGSSTLIKGLKRQACTICILMLEDDQLQNKLRESVPSFLVKKQKNKNKQTKTHPGLNRGTKKRRDSGLILCHMGERGERKRGGRRMREKRGGGRTGSTFVCISSHNRKRPVASPSQWLRFCFPPPACFPGGGGGGGRGGVERRAPKTAG